MEWANAHGRMDVCTRVNGKLGRLMDLELKPEPMAPSDMKDSGTLIHPFESKIYDIYNIYILKERHELYVASFSLYISSLVARAPIQRKYVYI
jgi:hypothetical protein